MHMCKTVTDRHMKLLTQYGMKDFLNSQFVLTAVKLNIGTPALWNLCVH